MQDLQYVLPNSSRCLPNNSSEGKFRAATILPRTLPCQVRGRGAAVLAVAVSAATARRRWSPVAVAAEGATAQLQAGPCQARGRGAAPG